jgi:hypothetical protein
MSKKNLVIVLGLILLGCVSFGVWYFTKVPSLEQLKNTTIDYLGNTEKPDPNNQTWNLIKNNTETKNLTWLTGICSPFQKNTQSILVNENSTGTYTNVYLLESPNGKILKNLTFASSKPYSETLSYIKSNCLADIFSDKEKYKEIYRNNDSSQLSEIDYAVEYAKYTFQQEQKANVKELCGTPDLVEYLYANNFTFPYKVTEDQLRLCVNAKNGEDPNKPLENTFGNIELVKEAIQKSQLLP